MFMSTGGHIIFNVSDKYLKEYDMFKDGSLDSAVDNAISTGLWKGVEREISPYIIREETCVIYIATVI